MKPSAYNIIFDHNSEKLAFNSISCVLAKINDDFINIIDNLEDLDKNNLSDKQKDLIKNMLDNGFIVDNNIDELSLLEHKFNKTKYSSDNPSITILPTTACNCRCYYCFEGKEKKSAVISEEVKQAIYKQISLLTNGKKSFHVTWFGGEPLLAVDDILQMSKKIIKICNETHVNYSSGIITNGTLIDDNVVKKIIESKITNIHITLDGTPKIHDNIRKLHNGNGTFNTIIKNIKLCLENNLFVELDIHINSMTDNEVKDLLTLLKNEGLENCYIGFGALCNYSNVLQNESSLTTEEYGRKCIEYEKFMNKIGLNKKWYLEDYPSSENKVCTAGRLNSFVVAPTGDLYSCWPDIGDKKKSTGNITTINDIRDIFNYNRLKYMLFSPFNHQKCRECNVLPICMGGCINKALSSGTPQCTSWKYILIDRIKHIYDIETSV